MVFADATVLELAEKIGSTKLMIVLIAHLVLDGFIFFKVLQWGKRGDWVWARELEEERREKLEWRETARQGPSVASQLIELLELMKRRQRRTRRG